MPEKPLILFIPRWYPDKENSLHGIFIRRHAEAASRFAKIAVIYATYDADPKSKLIHFEETSSPDISEIIYYYKKNITGIGFADRIIKLVLYFICMNMAYKKTCLKHGKPELCHVNVMKRTGIFAVYLKWFHNLKFVYSEHWAGYTPAFGDFYGFKKIITKFCLARTEVLMPETYDCSLSMKSHGISGHYKVIPNVVDTNLFKVGLRIGNKNIKTAIHISNLNDHQKNITGIINVINHVSANRSDFVLHIVGSSPNIQIHKDYASKLNLLNKSIFFLGSKTGEDLVNAINNSDFLFMFSNYENQPCVIAEALACGKPILATSVGGISEMVDVKAGILSSSGDVKKMAECFIAMLDNYQNYDNLRIRSIAEGIYSYPKVGNQISDVYKEVLSK